MGRTGPVTTVDTTGKNVFDSAAGCTTLYIKCMEDSLNPIEVNIPGLHDPGEYFPMAIGEDFYFRAYDNGITTAWVRGSGGDAKVKYTPSAVTYQ